MENTLGVKVERTLLLSRGSEDFYCQGVKTLAIKGYSLGIRGWDEHSWYRGVVPSQPAPVPRRKGNATCLFGPAGGNGTRSRAYGPSIHAHGALPCFWAAWGLGWSFWARLGA